MRRHEPIRTCVGCGERDRQTALLRLRVTSDGRLSEAGQTGRSAYVHARARCARELARSKRLARALRANVDQAQRAAFANALETRLEADAGEAGKAAARQR